MKKVKLLKTLLIPTIGITAIGTIAAVSTSCSSTDDASYMCVTANADSDLELINESVNNPDLQYSIDGSHWATYSEALNIPANREIYLRGNNKNGWSLSDQIYSHFNITGNVSISGNVMGLLDDGAGTISSIPNDYCFYWLFYGSTGITSVSKNFLPATTLANFCYTRMFANCTSLWTPPDLPATTLAESCYWSMFEGCTILTTAPALPAATLADACYNYMFNGCTLLTVAPALPATKLAYGCYNCMFLNCTSLRTAPALPATTLANGCYEYMFDGCTHLASVRIGYTGNYDYGCFSHWVNGVASSGTFYYKGSDTLESFGFTSGWTINPN